MPYSYKPDLSRLSDAEKEIAYRVIGGSNQLYKEFVESANRNPRDAQRAHALVKRISREQAEVEAGKRSPGHYPSLGAHIEFLRVHNGSQEGLPHSIKAALGSYSILTQNPEAVQFLFGEPTNLQNGQKPEIVALGCIDSRLTDLPKLLSAHAGQVLSRREPALDIAALADLSPQIPVPISLSAAVSISMGVKAGARHVVLVPHGRCGGIAAAARYIDQPCPTDPEESIHWKMAQAKREVFDDVRKNGPDYYLSRLDRQPNHESDDPPFLQAAEICSALKDMRVVKEFVSYLKGGENVTVSMPYVDFRTLNPHLLRVTGAGADDWELLRLTDHPAIPCAYEKKAGHAHSGHALP